MGLSLTIYVGHGNNMDAVRCVLMARGGFQLRARNSVLIADRHRERWGKNSPSLLQNVVLYPAKSGDAKCPWALYGQYWRFIVPTTSDQGRGCTKTFCRSSGFAQHDISETQKYHSYLNMSTGDVWRPRWLSKLLSGVWDEIDHA